jgi:hypothetical protein
MPGGSAAKGLMVADDRAPHKVPADFVFFSFYKKTGAGGSTDRISGDLAGREGGEEKENEEEKGKNRRLPCSFSCSSSFSESLGMFPFA